MTRMDIKEFENRKRDLKKFKLMKINITSGSMEPVIKTGESAALVPVEGPLKPFDIIVFWNEGTLTCHFVWHINRSLNELNEKTIVTRSMALYEDLPFPENLILGKVVSHKISWGRKFFLRCKDF